MLDFLIDNIFVTFGGRVFHQTVGILMGTNCAPLHADLFLYYYEADFIHIRKKDKKWAISFNSTFRYIDDVLSLNNSKFGDYVERIYPMELEIKDTTDTVKSAWNNRFTNHIGYVPYVVTTIPLPFMNVIYRIRLFTGFVIT